MKLKFTFLEKYNDFALLVLRLGIGIIFLTVHGYGKVMGGPERWTLLGGAMENLGITWAPVAWGLIAALTEAVGGILIALGFLFRPAALLLLLTMIVATISHIAGGDALSTTSHPLKMAFVFFALMFIGPGKFSLDAKFK